MNKLMVIYKYCTVMISPILGCERGQLEVGMIPTSAAPPRRLYYKYSGTPLNRTPLGPEVLSVIKGCPQLRGSYAHVRDCARKYLVACSRLYTLIG